MYKGRFSPSPTGPLHFGSLITATASYLEAKSQQGHWLVRIEDIDPPREQSGAAANILNTLEAFGFEWDEEVMFQSGRTHAYDAALETLKKQNLIYPCTCSRKEIADSASHGIEGVIYPGTCRNGINKARASFSWKLRTNSTEITFEDGLQGHQSQLLEKEIGDFVVKRADGLYAYQLAVVVDDAFQEITHVVRGTDLMISTQRQIFLQNLLGYPTPLYTHLPIAVNSNGEKLSKQTLATPIDPTTPAPKLWQALDFLGQHPSPELRWESLSSLWSWARSHWNMALVDRRLTKHYQSSFD